MRRPIVELVTNSVSRQGGGVAVAVQQVARGLASGGSFEVQVLTTLDGDLRRDWPMEEVEVCAYRFFGPAGFRFSPGLFWRVLTSGADVLQVHGLWAFHGLAVLLWHFRTGRPYVVVPHGMLGPWILQRSARRKAWVGALYQGLLLELAAGFQVLTETEAGEVRATCPSARCVVIPNSVDLVAPSKGRPDWYAEVGSGRRIYLFFGRIHEQKGWRELCAAWAQLCRSDAGFAEQSQLVFCGGADQAADFGPVVALLRAEFGNVLHAGPQYGEDKLLSLAASHVLVLPSKSEGQPMAVLEAWSHGKPVLMTEACNLPQGFECGAALRIGADAASIGDGLRQVSGWDAARLAEMGEAGRGLLARDFAPVVVMAQLRALLESAMEGAR